MKILMALLLVLLLLVALAVATGTTLPVLLGAVLCVTVWLQLYTTAGIGA
jgi:hypothetical protein